MEEQELVYCCDVLQTRLGAIFDGDVGGITRLGFDVLD